MDAKPSGRLSVGGKSYSPEAQKAAEGHVRAGGLLKVAFNIDDSTGKFNNGLGTTKGDVDADAFDKAIASDNADDVLLGIKASAIKDPNSDIRKSIMKKLDVKDLYGLRDAAKGDTEKMESFEEIAKVLLEKYAADKVRIDKITSKFDIYP